MRQGAKSAILEPAGTRWRASPGEIQAEGDVLRSEPQEARDREAATAEVLQVIDSSPGDLVAVFGAVLEKANRLCETAFGVLCTFDGARCLAGASTGRKP